MSYEYSLDQLATARGAAFEAAGNLESIEIPASVQDRLEAAITHFRQAKVA